MTQTKEIKQQTRCWLDKLIIAHQICPFAKRERDRGSIRFYVAEKTDMKAVLDNLLAECQLLEKQPEIETTLFILANITQDFEEFLDFLEIASELLVDQGYEGIFQLASFHPDYLFAGSDDADAANYTNRSPYPMLHIIREKSLAKALEHYASPELIPERNIQFCREQGLEAMISLLHSCTRPSSNS
jgi:hypothetical protein